MPHIKDSISRWLSEIQKAIKEHTEATKKYQQANDREREQRAETETKTVVRLPVEVTEYYGSENSERTVKNQRERIRIILEVCGIVVAVILSVLTLCSLLVFNGQLKEMRRQTDISERPWLSVNVAPIGDLKFRPDGSIDLKVQMSITNVGKSIAKEIWPHIKLFPQTVENSILLPIPAEIESTLCARPSMPIGMFDLFPSNQPTEQKETIGVLPKDVSAYLTKDSENPPRAFIGFYIAGCVSYHSSFGPEIHETRFAYYLDGKTPTYPDGSFVVLPGNKPVGPNFEFGVDTPLEKLGMGYAMFGENDAN